MADVLKVREWSAVDCRDSKMYWRYEALIGTTQFGVDLEEQNRTKAAGLLRAHANEIGLHLRDSMQLAGSRYGKVEFFEVSADG